MRMVTVLIFGQFRRFDRTERSIAAVMLGYKAVRGIASCSPAIRPRM